MKRCETCKEWMFYDSHKCKPRWEVRILGDDGFGYCLNARDHEEAAEKVAEDYDVDEFPIASESESIDVAVRRWGSDEAEQCFNVTGHFEAVYFANEIDEPEAGI